MAQVINLLLDTNTNTFNCSAGSSSGQQINIRENIYGSIGNVQYSVFCVIVDNFQYKWANKQPETYVLSIGVQVSLDTTQIRNIFLFLGERALKNLTFPNPLRLIIVENLSQRYLVPLSQSYSRILLEAFAINGNFYHELRGGKYAKRSQQFASKAQGSRFLKVVNLNHYFVLNKRNNFLEIQATDLIKAVIEALF